MTILRVPVQMEVDLTGYTDTQRLVILTCYACSSPIAMTSDHYRRAKEDHTVNFFCSKGHSQIFSTSRVQELESKLATAQEQANREAEQRRNAVEALSIERKRHSALAKRVSQGVCPHCHRTFQQVARHIASKHPAAP